MKNRKKLIINLSSFVITTIVMCLFFTGCTCEHQYVSKVTKDATCSEEGVRTYTCTKCENTYTQAIPKNDNHQYKLISETAPTVLQNGFNLYSCSRCGHSYTETIPRLKSDWEVYYNDSVRGAFDTKWIDSYGVFAGYTMQIVIAPVASWMSQDDSGYLQLFETGDTYPFTQAFKNGTTYEMTVKCGNKEEKFDVKAETQGILRLKSSYYEGRKTPMKDFEEIIKNNDSVYCSIFTWDYKYMGTFSFSVTNTGFAEAYRNVAVNA